MSSGRRLSHRKTLRHVHRALTTESSKSISPTRSTIGDSGSNRTINEIIILLGCYASYIGS
jgi:hypothetical protein